jgi:hypothetical protein
LSDAEEFVAAAEFAPLSLEGVAGIVVSPIRSADSSADAPPGNMNCPEAIKSDAAQETKILRVFTETSIGFEKNDSKLPPPAILLNFAYG